MNQEKFFWFEDGTRLISIKDLFESIPDLRDEYFKKHAEKKDFVKWIEEVFGEKLLAKRLVMSKTKDEYLFILKQFIFEKIKKDQQTASKEAVKKREEKKDKEAGVKKEDEIILDRLEFESFAVQIQTYNFKYNKLKEKAAALRKAGKDLYMAELKLMSFKAKLHLAEVTRDQKDLVKLKNILIDAEKEIQDAEKEEVIDVKKEVEEGAKKMIAYASYEQAKQVQIQPHAQSQETAQSTTQ